MAGETGTVAAIEPYCAGGRKSEMLDRTYRRLNSVGDVVGVHHRIDAA
jgi:hypothetical protein